MSHRHRFRLPARSFVVPAVVACLLLSGVMADAAAQATQPYRPQSQPPQSQRGSNDDLVRRQQEFARQRQQAQQEAQIESLRRQNELNRSRIDADRAHAERMRRAQETTPATTESAEARERRERAERERLRDDLQDPPPQPR